MREAKDIIADIEKYTRELGEVAKNKNELGVYVLIINENEEKSDEEKTAYEITAMMMGDGRALGRAARADDAGFTQLSSLAFTAMMEEEETEDEQDDTDDKQ